MLNRVYLNILYIALLWQRSFQVPSDLVRGSYIFRHGPSQNSSWLLSKCSCQPLPEWGQVSYTRTRSS